MRDSYIFDEAMTWGKGRQECVRGIERLIAKHSKQKKYKDCEFASWQDLRFPELAKWFPLGVQALANSAAYPKAFVSALISFWEAQFNYDNAYTRCADAEKRLLRDAFPGAYQGAPLY